MFHVQNLATKVEGLQVKPGNKLQITVSKWQRPNFYQRVLIEQCTTVLTYFSKEIASRHYQVFLREKQHLVTNNANHSSLKFGDHHAHTPNPPESHATWSPSGHSARINLTPGKPPVG